MTKEDSIDDLLVGKSPRGYSGHGIRAENGADNMVAPDTRLLDQEFDGYAFRKYGNNPAKKVDPKLRQHFDRKKAQY